MELNEMEKRLIFQTEGYGKSDVTYELRMCLPYIPDPVRRKGSQESHGQNFQKLGKDMPYLFVKSWLPKTKINRTGTRSADNSANHVFFISFYLVQFCTSEKVYKGIMG